MPVDRRAGGQGCFSGAGDAGEDDAYHGSAAEVVAAGIPRRATDASVIDGAISHPSPIAHICGHALRPDIDGGKTKARERILYSRLPVAKRLQAVDAPLVAHQKPNIPVSR